MSDLPQLQPRDEHNRKLEEHVHPRDYKNPEPMDGNYNLVVIGAGTAGLVSAAGAAGLGAKVALIERDLLGGDCLNVGCVPSKALISSARRYAQVRDAGELGVNVPDGTQVDFAAVMERMRRLRAGIAPHDSVERFSSLGIDVFLGSGRFTGRDTVEVGGQQLRFAKAVIATGARAAVPPIPGIEEVPFLTNETVFSLTELPPRLGVIGAGPIGCELAQVFARLGSEVFLVESGSGVLPKEDTDAAEVVTAALKRDGVRVLGQGRKLEVSAGEAGSGAMLRVDGAYEHEVDQLLVASGRAPNVAGLGLEAAGVEFAASGITVDDRLRTSNRRIFAAGDVCSAFKFTHAADFMARTVIANALFAGRRKVSSLVIPWSTYTDPEIAHVGLSSRDAEARGIEIDSYTQPMDGVDRAILEGRTEGFVRIHTVRGKDKILGATIVGENAGDLIGEISLAMTNGIGLGAIANTIHPYPTIAEAIRKAGDLYNRTRLTPKVQKWMGRWLGWSRR